MKTTSETAAKRQVRELQAAIIDGLEDIKAINIRVFDTTDLSPLFERVIVASASSARQTKALAASVRDKIRDLGVDKPRIEGEENGEWVIVDCGTIVAHIMQPAIRDYYRLEEIWGDKPVRAAAKKATPQVAKTAAPAKAAGETAAARKPARTASGDKAAAGATDAKTASAGKAPTRSTAVKKPAVKRGKKAEPKTTPTGSAVKKTVAKIANKTAAKSAAKTVKAAKTARTAPKTSRKSTAKKD